MPRNRSDDGANDAVERAGHDVESSTEPFVQHSQPPSSFADCRPDRGHARGPATSCRSLKVRREAPTVASRKLVAHPRDADSRCRAAPDYAEIDDYDEQIKELINKIQSALENDLPNLKGNERNEVRWPLQAGQVRVRRTCRRNAHPRANRRPSLLVTSRKSNTSRAVSTGSGRYSTVSRSSCASCPRLRVVVTMT